jgi:hypothetical protein
MTSRREEILSRLETILSGLGASFLHNTADIVESRLPYIVLLDGDEDVMHGNEVFEKGRRATMPTKMLLQPEIWIVEKEGSANPGTLLNTWRSTILDAIVSDETLLRLVHNNDIRYEGCATAFRAGRKLTGEMGLNLAIVYIHRFNVD